MNNMSEIRDHTRSVTQTVKISGAQKMIATAHIGRVKEELDNAQPYHNKIKSSIASVLGDSNFQSDFIKQRSEPKCRGLLILSADKGLAGGYNQNVMYLADSELLHGDVAAVLAVGHVGFNKLERTCKCLDKNFFHQVESPTLDTAGEIADKIIGLFKDGTVDSFDVIYTYYKSAIHMIPTIERLIPISSKDFADLNPRQLEFSPSSDKVFEALIPIYLKGFLFGCLVNAWMSELSSRVTAMDSAIRNGNDMLSRLSLEYNRARQGSITQEITEIVSSASSMK